jgi:hypothetical protein
MFHDLKITREDTHIEYIVTMITIRTKNFRDDIKNTKDVLVILSGAEML